MAGNTAIRFSLAEVFAGVVAGAEAGRPERRGLLLVGIAAEQFVDQAPDLPGVLGELRWSVQLSIMLRACSVVRKPGLSDSFQAQCHVA